MKTDFKKEDILNRRQIERPLQLGVHDISCARYFTIGDRSERFRLKSREFSSDYAVYSLADQTWECIGFATADRNKMVISVHRHGLVWTSRVSLSSVHIFGSKSPDQ